MGMMAAIAAFVRALVGDPPPPPQIVAAEFARSVMADWSTKRKRVEQVVALISMALRTRKLFLSRRWQG